ncbi:beta-xylosidase [Ereboglobus sp. PH5-5]|uniref:family 43 glycosylhydrolase n=1 Tax=Ereboglobus sp. PH5-5 TaxID=2940529 RepID=UPI0024061BF2|nr:family 43 glycosylhydrolase [Ereboglobus sp. PH5-5]MDF9831815.1 beta-xylosidase [Ereboglobus sp. PH5-5]
MKTVFRHAILLVCIAGFAAAAGHARAGEFANPLMRGADPHAVVAGKTVWLYPTISRDRFYAFSSDDLKTWKRHGPVLDFKNVPWVGEDGREHHGAWAPGVIERDGTWYFYYSVGPKRSRIGVATAASPAGPFVDSGRPLLDDEGKRGFEAIDPMVFADPKSGKYYFYAGGSAGSKLRVFELNKDMVSFAAEVPVETPAHFTEGAFMHFRDGVYYLSYSHGSYKRASYSVHYATSKSPVGPWKYRGAILKSDASHKGPGHHSFFKDPADGSDLIVYHRYDGQTGDGPYSTRRQIAIERVRYDKNGLILPIIMTDGRD